MQEMAMLSQAHKCLASSFFHSSCTRLSYLRANAVGSWRRELGFATALPAGRPHSFRRGCGRLLVTASEGKKTSWGEVAQNDQQQRLLQVVLVSPQIPGNTGCIARTCAATCVGLHLVEPMGFKIEDSKLKRAGLDYWPYVVVKVHKSWNDFFTYFQEQVCSLNFDLIRVCMKRFKISAFLFRDSSIYIFLVYHSNDMIQ
ncbi:hypothetical protein KC19_3G179200 [Ceratodon purpureus]|uniref:tRNA/rRNA methyltransferase SpoU type domain-containing protein n=1 Tax=Ceratodon purpureus TaxID=3225 RepID=A0A8T0IM33_CERPU|nr:hypothetical protein KC19_3G179200 [Ceratodon purpureus]